MIEQEIVLSWHLFFVQKEVVLLETDHLLLEKSVIEKEVVVSGLVLWV